MKNSTIQRVVILGAIALFFVIATQTYWLVRTWDINERDFDRSVNISLQNVAQELSVVNQSILPTQDLIKRLSSNTYAVNINSKIDASLLDFYLKKHFQQSSMIEDFDYAIYDCHDEKMVYGKYVAYSASSDSTKVGKDFPKLDDATAIYFFVVRFPKRSSYMLGSMAFTIVLTIISFLTVLFFIYALVIILRQKRLSELQKDFINNMTHEFKTPISTIKIAADVFSATPFIQNDARLSKYAQIMREQNNRLNSQVEKVLQISQIDRETLELNLEIINLHELLETVLPSIQVKIEEQNGVLEKKLAATQAYIRADTLHLTNILHNLLDNAIKYAKAGKPQIEVSSFDSDKKLVLKITDAGIGIDKEHQKKVFHRFYRVPTGNVHNVKGFGLGLFYVKNIVEAHGWSIAVDSEVGKFTTMTLEMPKVIHSTTQNVSSEWSKSAEGVR
jgi:two-component system, OmpR family, phosphate regulon sensor histidine kinase PhoR